MKFRVATYNVHKCRGLDRRVRPERIVEVARELEADIIGLQEVIAKTGGAAEEDQAKYIADQLGMTCHFGENRQHRGAPYGNAVLSQFPVKFVHNYDLTWRGRERRGCLRADVEVAGQMVHIFNVHLGTAFMERRHQGRELIGEKVLKSAELTGPRIVFGDFNEWTRGLASRLMAEHFQSVDLKVHLRSKRTYPGVLPVMHLDHFYYDERLKLVSFALHRTRKSLVASDHLPMVAEFEW